MRWLWILGLVISINSFGQDMVKELKKQQPEMSLISLLDSIILNQLGYEELDSLESKVNISHSDSNTKIVIRDYVDPNPSPLIVVNQHLIENKKDLDGVVIKDVKSISVLSPKKGPPIYGHGAVNGAIIVALKKRKAKEIFNQ